MLFVETVLGGQVVIHQTIDEVDAKVGWKLRSSGLMGKPVIFTLTPISAHQCSLSEHAKLVGISEKPWLRPRLHKFWWRWSRWAMMGLQGTQKRRRPHCTIKCSCSSSIWEIKEWHIINKSFLGSFSKDIKYFKVILSPIPLASGVPKSRQWSP